MLSFWIGRDWVTVYRLFIHILVVPVGEATALLKGVSTIACREQARKWLKLTGNTRSLRLMNYCMQRK